MEIVELRLSEFADLYLPEPKETIRSIIARDEAPFDPKSPDGKQRTYGAPDILAWALFTRFRKMGLEVTEAARELRANRIVDRIMDAVHGGDNIANLFVTAECHEKRADKGQIRATWVFSLRTLDGVAEVLSGGAFVWKARNVDGERPLGLSGATIVPVLPVMQWCQSAVVKKGFLMNGRFLTEGE